MRLSRTILSIAYWYVRNLCTRIGFPFLATTDHISIQGSVVLILCPCHSFRMQWRTVHASRMLASLSIFFGLLVSVILAVSVDLPINLEVRAALNSRSANVHISQAHHSVYPFTVTYGACHSLISQHEQHHPVAKVYDRSTDRLVWILPDVISITGCLSAWSLQDELVGLSEPLQVNKYSRQWLKKKHLDFGTKLSKRASIPMNNASGIDAEGPWFDGVEALKETEISAVNVAEAKAKSENHTGRLRNSHADALNPEIAIVGAGMSGLMTWVSIEMDARSVEINKTF